jgi:hypothetical protein
LDVPAHPDCADDAIARIEVIVRLLRARIATIVEGSYYSDRLVTDTVSEAAYAVVDLLTTNPPDEAFESLVRRYTDGS